MDLETISTTYEADVGGHTYRVNENHKYGITVNRRRIGDSYIPPCVSQWNGTEWCSVLHHGQPVYLESLEEAKQVIENAVSLDNASSPAP